MRNLELTAGASWLLGAAAVFAQSGTTPPNPATTPVVPLPNQPAAAPERKPLPLLPESRPGPEPAQEQSVTSVSFRSLDANSDGRITKAEARGNSALSSSFGKLDADGNGSLSPDEYSLSASGKGSVQPAGGADNNAGVPAFTTMDINRDGNLSREEVRGDTQLTTSFSALDTNHDGNLSLSEYRVSGETNTQYRQAPAGG